MVSQGNPYLERAIAFKVDGRYDEASAELSHLLEEDPNSSDAHHQFGLVLGFIGDFDASLEHLQRAVTLAPSRIDIRNDLALTYSMLGMYDEAATEFKEVLARDPENKRALESLRFLSEPV
ncbi:MAG TPA: tetratricopeptide repeat protein [Chthonomonadaceae bacterium]|nr:tetratricopeptide repeat protein [Chthonomonadaceae bacterium]